MKDLINNAWCKLKRQIIFNEATATEEKIGSFFNIFINFYILHCLILYTLLKIVSQKQA